MTASAMALSVAGILASGANAQTGGAVAPGDAPAPTTTATPSPATLLTNGTAVAPAGAPTAVVNAIAAGNQIRNRKYVWGGGHRSFFSKGYDCSGAVSYVLHGAGLLASPIPSGPLMSWGAPGPGSWITVYANRGHTYMVVAGLRFDTSSAGETIRRGKPGTGPRWRTALRPTTGYAVRHYVGY
ncbi:MAG: peptidoglycan endopeptidase [Solirubrobacterales bacterium]